MPHIFAYNSRFLQQGTKPSKQKTRRKTNNKHVSCQNLSTVKFKYFPLGGASIWKVYKEVLLGDRVQTINWATNQMTTFKLHTLPLGLLT